MKRLHVTIIDLITRGPTKSLFSRIMNANYASVMPQAIAVWCEELGHEVEYVCYTGTEDITGSLAERTDVLFVGAFTRSAYVAAAISARYRQAGAVTVLGGPHARSYPQDAARYFDYVLGFTGKAEIEEILRERAPRPSMGRQLSATSQPQHLPGVRERWKFIKPTIDKAPTIKLVPMIGSMGCPYTCSFCIDSTVPYQPLGFDQIRADLRFLTTVMERPKVAWHDPNFGIRFNDYMDAIEDAIESGQVKFAAESSLSLLSHDNLKRLKRNGFIGMLPGIESWYDFGNKSKSSCNRGLDKVRQVSEHINLVLQYIPFVQTNFVLGLDSDEGAEPFELTKKFIDLTPGAYPAFSLFTCYGQAAPMNLELQGAGRVLPVPFHLLDSVHAMNIVPANYVWDRFYDLCVDLLRHSMSPRAVYRRLQSNGIGAAGWFNLVRSASSRRINYNINFANLLKTDHSFRNYFESLTTALPAFFHDRIRRELGHFWPLLPNGALEHDPNAYLKSQTLLSHHRPERPFPRSEIGRTAGRMSAQTGALNF